MKYIKAEYEREIPEFDMADGASIDDYIDVAIRKNELTSDRQLAKALNVSSSAVNHWRRGISWPADETMVQLATLAGAEAEDALLHLNYWRSKTPETKEIYSTLIGAQWQAKGPNGRDWFIDEDVKWIAIICAIILPLLTASPSEARTDREQSNISAFRPIHYTTFIRWLKELLTLTKCKRFRPLMASLNA